MWKNILNKLNGKSLIPEPSVTSESLNLFTDASLQGFGGFFNGYWFSHPRPATANHHISVLELFAVLAAVSTWSIQLSNRQIIIFTDNEPIVSMWKSGSSKDKAIMALVRELFFTSTNHNISVTFRHIPGTNNVYADLLSCLQVERFMSIFLDCFP